MSYNTIELCLYVHTIAITVVVNTLIKMCVHSPNMDMFCMGVDCNIHIDMYMYQCVDCYTFTCIDASWWCQLPSLIPEPVLE